MRTALIDADIVIYQVAAACETSIDWGEGDVNSHADTTEMKTMIHSRVAEIVRAAECDEFIMVLSDAENFRKTIYPKYKANRKDRRKPVGFSFCHSYVLHEFCCKTKRRLEADDVMGILQTREGGKLGETVICSIDKDMMTIPGWHYNWWRDEEGVVEILEWEADLAFYAQVLTGDSTDNYPGCPGVGPVKADRALSAVFSLAGDPDLAVAWKIIVDLYAAKGLTEENAIVQAQLARILRAEDYDFRAKEVIPWTPTATS